MDTDAGATIEYACAEGLHVLDQSRGGKIV